MSFQNTLLLSALKGQNKSSPPVWFMRQAGRYMPQYQKLKEKYSLNTMFSKADLITEVTLFPIDLLDVDAAILFADILTLLEGLGIKWSIVDGVGPVIDPVIDVSHFHKIEAKIAYAHIAEAVIELKKRLHCPLIGFAGGPFTVAAYLVEGKLTKDLKIIKKWIYSNPKTLHLLLEKIADATIDYLNLQIDSGVDAIQLFDSWAGLLSHSAFKEFSLLYLKKVMDGIKHRNIPVILFCRGSFLYAKELASLSPSAISFDWQGELGSIKDSLPSSIALQGNLDPLVLFGSKEIIKKEASDILNQMQGSPRFIFNLGHGILPETPFDHVKYLVDVVKGG